MTGVDVFGELHGSFINTYTKKPFSSIITTITISTFTSTLIPGVVVAFTDKPELKHVMEGVAIVYDDIFFGVAPNSLRDSFATQELKDKAKKTIHAESESEVSEYVSADKKA